MKTNVDIPARWRATFRSLPADLRQMAIDLWTLAKALKANTVEVRLIEERSYHDLIALQSSGLLTFTYSESQPIDDGEHDYEVDFVVTFVL